MVDLSAIAGAMSALKATKDITEAMFDLRDASAFQSKRLELQSKIIDAQTSIFQVNEERSSLLKQVDELEKRIAAMEEWRIEKTRYQLVALSPHVNAYAVKESMRGEEPPHYICGNCFNGGKKSFLNQTVRGTHIDIFRCNNCSEELSVKKDQAHRRDNW